MGKKFRIINNEVHCPEAFHPYWYRIEQRHTILFFIHWWSTPEFEPPHNFEFVCDAIRHIKEHFPNAIIYDYYSENKCKKIDIMTQYIPKSAVVAEIERRLCLLVPKMTFHQQRVELEKLLSFLDTLEVKEVDLDNDLFEEVYSHLDDIKDTADRMTSGNFMHHRAAIKYSANVIEKVLGLIGLKAQKGE